MTGVLLAAPAQAQTTGAAPGSAAAPNPVAAAPVDDAYQALTPKRLLDTRPGSATVDGQAQGAGAVPGGSIISLPVWNRGGVPGGADGVGAVVLNVTVTGPTSAGYVSVYPDGEALPTASNLNFVPGQTVPNLVVVKVGAGGRVNLFNFTGSTHLIADVMGWFPEGPAYAGIAPKRLLDTRPGMATFDGQAQGGGAVAGGSSRSLPVLNRGDVPSSGVGAVVLNVTVTEPTTGGYVSVFPGDEASPTASNLNFVVGQTVANLVVVKVPVGGTVNLFNSFGSTHLIADVMGWFPVGPAYSGIAPKRLLDTRPGSATIDGGSQGGGAVPGGNSFSLPVLGRGGVPTINVGAVVLNVTVAEPTAGGYVTVFPGGEPLPTASNLNFVAGQTVPNLVVVKVGTEGRVNLFNSSGSTHLIADVMGWFPTGPGESILVHQGRGQAINEDNVMVVRTVDASDDQPVDNHGVGGFVLTAAGERVNLAIPAGEGFFEVSTGINAAGDVAGWAGPSPSSPDTKGIVWNSAGVPRVIPGMTEANDINDAGVVVGLTRGISVVLASVHSPGTPVALALTSPMGASFCAAEHVNNAGTAIGRCYFTTDTTLTARGVAWNITTRAPTLLPLAPGATDSVITDISESGIVVGNSNIGGTVHGLRWASPTATPVDLGAGLQPSGVNTAGYIVGTYQPNPWNLAQAACIPPHVGATWQDLGPSHSSLATDINDRNAVSGAVEVGANLYVARFTC